MATKYLLEFYTSFRILLVLWKGEVETRGDSFSGRCNYYNSDACCYAGECGTIGSINFIRKLHVVNDSFGEAFETCKCICGTTCLHVAILIYPKGT